MAASICPIFDEKASFIGIWALNRNFQPSLGTLAELMSLAEPTLQALSRLPQRRVENESVEVGNDVRFEGGVFVMLQDNLAPNEELSRPNSQIAYGLVNQLGIACLQRTQRSDPRIKAPPPRATPPQGGTAEVRQAAEALRKWWQFWR